MAIPTKLDRDLQAVDQLHASVIMKLRQIVSPGWISTTTGYAPAPAPSPERRRELRELLQRYVDSVMAIAPAAKPTKGRVRADNG